MLRKLLLASFVVVSLSWALAQQPTPKSEPVKPPTREAALWLEDANVLTAEMVNDQLSGDYAPFTYLLHARLAQSWWKTDPNKAKQHLATAAAAARERTTETPLQVLRRLQVAAMIANSVVIPLDPIEGDKMLDSILEQAAKVGPQAKSMDEMNAKNNFARELSGGVFDRNSTTQRQVKQYRALLGLGSGEATSILHGIYYKDNALGDQLYGEALDAIANGTLPVVYLADLGYFSFPKQPDLFKVEPEMTDRMLLLVRDKILQAHATGLTRQMCWDLGPAMRLLPHLQPSAQAEVTPVIAECKPLLGPSSAQNIDSLINQKPPTTADEYLQLAANAKTAKERAGYKRMAISALREEDPEKALQVIDGVTAEEREFMPDRDFTRDGIEIRVISARYKAQDYSGLQNLIERSPLPQKTALRIAGLAANENPSYALSLLPVIVDKLADGKVDDSRFYTDVIAYVGKFARPMLPVVFRDAVKGLNQCTEFLPSLMNFPHEKSNTMIYDPFWSKMEPARLPQMFDVLDPRSTRLIIDSVKFPVARQSFRLWLLNNELKEYENALKPKTTEKTGEGKGAQTTN